MYKRIRELREERRMTQRQVADYLYMSQTGYAKYETGENDPSTYVLVALAELYDTSVDYILGLTHDSERDVR